MFSAFCPRHGAAVLLGPSDIEALHNAPEGIEVVFRCSCGHVGVWRTGAGGAAGALAG